MAKIIYEGDGERIEYELPEGTHFHLQPFLPASDLGIVSELLEQEHQHTYVYQGVKYKRGDLLPGSGAYQVLYFDHYFCTGCLDHRYEQLAHTSSRYAPIAYNATPLPPGADPVVQSYGSGGWFDRR